MSNQLEIAKYLEKNKHKCELCGSIVDKPIVKQEDREVNKHNEEHKPVNEGKPSRKELLAMLDEMNKGFDDLPRHVQYGFVTQCDLNAAMLLIAQILKNS